MRAGDERLDRVREVDRGDVVVAALHADPVRLQQHACVRVARRRLEAVGGQLDQEPERVLEVDRVHEAAVLDAAVADPALVEALDRLRERRLGERERDVMHAARVGRRAARIAGALLVGEDRDQPPVARVEVQMALRRVVEVGLLEDERHPEQALPEVDRRLPAGADERDVVDALALQLAQLAHRPQHHRRMPGLSSRSHAHLRGGSRGSQAALSRRSYGCDGPRRRRCWSCAHNDQPREHRTALHTASATPASPDPDRRRRRSAARHRRADRAHAAAGQEGRHRDAHGQRPGRRAGQRAAAVRAHAREAGGRDQRHRVQRHAVPVLCAVRQRELPRLRHGPAGQGRVEDAVRPDLDPRSRLREGGAGGARRGAPEPPLAVRRRLVRQSGPGELRLRHGRVHRQGRRRGGP